MAEMRARQKRYRRGRRAEWLAGLYLQLKGYRILARRYSSPVGEIDLIARRGHEVAFIEVKLRPTLEQAAYSLSHHQKRRICRAAGDWQMRQALSPADHYSFDVVLLAPWCWPRHMRQAFEAPLDC